MIIVMEEGANHAQITMVTEKLIECGFEVHRSIGERHIIIGAIGAKTVDPREYEILPGVRDVIRITAPYKLVSRHFNPEGTIIRIKDVEIGGTEVIVMAGPCSDFSTANLHIFNTNYGPLRIEMT